MLKLELSEQMIAVIGQALGQAPYNVAAPVVAEIQKQINAQKAPRVVASDDNASVSS